MINVIIIGALIVTILILLALIIKQKHLLQASKTEFKLFKTDTERQLSELSSKYSPIIDVDREIELKQMQIDALQIDIRKLTENHFSLSQMLIDLGKQKDSALVEISSLKNQIEDLTEKKVNGLAAFSKLEKDSNELHQKIKSLDLDFQELSNKYQKTLNDDDELKIEAESIKIEINDQKIKLEQLNEKYKNALELHADLEKQIDLYKDTLEISEYGLYQSKFSFDLPEQYKLELESNYQKQKQLITSDTAVKCYTEWTVGGSAVEGRKMTKHYTKLMLYAFNGECDGLIAKVKWNNALKAELRIWQTFNNINKLGNTHNISITKEFLDLKLKELSLNYEYEQKKYEEKEEQRRIREQMREEEKAQKEFEKAQREAEDEERKYQKALDKARQELNISFASPGQVELLNDKIKALEINLQEARAKKERALSLAQMTKVGHIYVISNIGSFGENIYKIGMTRRLDPLDRVKELGDASVPFQFDIHAIIYSENAPQLEYELHRKFSDRRLNRINNRKEFFRVTLDEIEIFVNQHGNAKIEFTKLAEAREYRETLTLIEQLNKLINTPKEEGKFPTSII